MLCCQGDPPPPPPPPLFSARVWLSGKGWTNLFVFRGQGGITEGLVKGALYVATSAYKALFTGPNCSIQVREWRLSSQIFPSAGRKKMTAYIYTHYLNYTEMPSCTAPTYTLLSDQMETGCFGSPWLWNYACFLPIFLLMPIVPSRSFFLSCVLIFFQCQLETPLDLLLLPSCS